MKVTLIALITGLVLTTNVASTNVTGQDTVKANKKATDKFDVKALVGKWTVVAGERSGEKIDASRFATLNQDNGQGAYDSDWRR